MELYTDASGTIGYGGYFNWKWFQGRWLPHMQLSRVTGISIGERDFTMFWAAFTLAFFAFLRSSELPAEEPLRIVPALIYPCPVHLLNQIWLARSGCQFFFSHLRPTRFVEVTRYLLRVRHYFSLALPQGPFFFSFHSGCLLTRKSVVSLLRHEACQAGLPYTLFFFYKNIEAEICEILRIF